MKVAHISYKDDQEGAAIAVSRLCQALVDDGIDSKILVQKKVSDKSYTFHIAVDKIGKLFSVLRVGTDLLINSFFSNKGEVYYTLPFIGTDITKHPIILEADIIHIHWINRGFLNLKSIQKIINLNKPVVFTLHDSWAFTGGCHMTYDCEKYQNACFKCPIASKVDFSSFFQKKKKYIFKNKLVSFTAPSEWMSQKAKSSNILENKNIVTIANCVDTKVFRPINSLYSRDVFNLPKDKRIILFNITNDPRKGGAFIRDIILDMSFNRDILFVGFGASDLEHTIFKGLPFLALGRINDQYSMAALYNACDLMIAPAAEEPFGQTYIEAMACGTPCVAFNHSGPKDIIKHKVNGYLAKYNDKADLILGIEFCLLNRDWLSEKAIQKVKQSFSSIAVSRILVEFYETLLSSSQYED
jgi:glycosyltransferase involved in cell wall biosynthesis